MKTNNEYENGLIVNFTNSNKYAVEAMIENSEFYGYEIEENVYLFPSQKSEYDILEKALTAEFARYRIFHFYFEGV